MTRKRKRPSSGADRKKKEERGRKGRVEKRGGARKRRRKEIARGGGQEYGRGIEWEGGGEGGMGTMGGGAGKKWDMVGKGKRRGDGKRGDGSRRRTGDGMG